MSLVHKVVAVLALGCMSLTPVLASPRDGARLRYAVVQASGKKVFPVVLTGGETTTIELTVSGNSPLDVIVYDTNCNVVTSMREVRDAGIVNVVPKATGSYYIVVRNEGSEETAFRLIIR
jgi:hypothetical protein